MLNVTVERSRWGRGSLSSLKSSVSQKNCCLGFVCEKIGMPEKYYLDLGDINMVLSQTELENSEEYRKQIPKLVGRLCQISDWVSNIKAISELNLYSESKLHRKLININDNMEMSDTEREKLIIEEGLKADINFTFVD